LTTTFCCDAQNPPNIGSFFHFTDISPEVCGVSERSLYASDTHKPDVIVIDADDQKKRMEGLHRVETSEGKQASSMLRMLASGGSGKLQKSINLYVGLLLLLFRVILTLVCNVP